MNGRVKRKLGDIKQILDHVIKRTDKEDIAFMCDELKDKIEVLVLEEIKLNSHISNKES